MTVKKRVQVVMLPTNKKAKIYFDEYGIFSRNRVNGKTLNHHLYFLSDEEIKEGDYVLVDKLVGKVVKSFENTLCEVDLGWSTTQTKNNCKKIVATTDSSLVIGTVSRFVFDENSRQRINTKIYLPQPSPDFIKVFIEEYNKGNVIEWVDVEYILNETGNYREIKRKTQSKLQKRNYYQKD